MTRRLLWPGELGRLKRSYTEPVCDHSGARIAPDVADPDQRIRCCTCGEPVSEEDWRRADQLRRETDEERWQRRVAEFEDLKAWADSLPELVLRLRPGEAHFAAVYEPYPGPESWRAGSAPSYYGMTVPLERLMEASGDLPEEQMDRFVEEFATRVRVRPGGGRLESSGRPNPVPFDSVPIKGRLRPEVYTIGEPSIRSPSENRPEDVDRLIRAREGYAARNLPGHRLFLDRAVVVHVRVFAWWTCHGLSRPSYGRMDRMGMSLAPVKVGVCV